MPGYEMLDAQRPFMTCGLDGEWTGVVNNPCVRTCCELLFCTVARPVHDTLNGARRRSGAVSVHAEITCAATSEGGAVWPETAAGTVQVLGECDSNHRMADGIPPYRACSINGDFETIRNPCLRTSPHQCGRRAAPAGVCALTVHFWLCAAPSAAIMCAAISSPGESDGGATWETTNAGDGEVWGTCLPGYTGNATRTCTAVNGTGVWSPVDSACERTPRVHLGEHSHILDADVCLPPTVWPQSLQRATATHPKTATWSTRRLARRWSARTPLALVSTACSACRAGCARRT